MKFHPDFHSLLRFLTSACFCTLKSEGGILMIILRILVILECVIPKLTRLFY